MTEKNFTSSSTSVDDRKLKRNISSENKEALRNTKEFDDKQTKPNNFDVKKDNNSNSNKDNEDELWDDIVDNIKPQKTFIDTRDEKVCAESEEITFKSNSEIDGDILDEPGTSKTNQVSIEKTERESIEETEQREQPSGLATPLYDE